MIHDIAMQWVAALRSKRWKKTHGTLKDEHGNCCLGVLCEVLDKKPMYRTNGAYEFDGFTATLPQDVRQRAQIKTGEAAPYRRVTIDGATFHSLADANDGGCTFEQIADWIEEHWEEL